MGPEALQAAPMLKPLSDFDTRLLESLTGKPLPIQLRALAEMMSALGKKAEQEGLA